MSTRAQVTREPCLWAQMGPGRAYSSDRSDGAHTQWIVASRLAKQNICSMSAIHTKDADITERVSKPEPVFFHASFAARLASFGGGQIVHELRTHHLECIAATGGEVGGGEAQ